MQVSLKWKNGTYQSTPSSNQPGCVLQITSKKYPKYLLIPPKQVAQMGGLKEKNTIIKISFSKYAPSKLAFILNADRLTAEKVGNILAFKLDRWSDTPNEFKLFQDNFNNFKPLEKIKNSFNKHRPNALLKMCVKKSGIEDHAIDIQVLNSFSKYYQSIALAPEPTFVIRFSDEFNASIETFVSQLHTLAKNNPLLKKIYFYRVYPRRLANALEKQLKKNPFSGIKIVLRKAMNPAKLILYEQPKPIQSQITTIKWQLGQYNQTLPQGACVLQSTDQTNLQYIVLPSDRVTPLGGLKDKNTRRLIVDLTTLAASKLQSIVNASSHTATNVGRQLASQQSPLLANGKSPELQFLTEKFNGPKLVSTIEQSFTESLPTILLNKAVTTYSVFGPPKFDRLDIKFFPTFPLYCSLIKNRNETEFNFKFQYLLNQKL